MKAMQIEDKDGKLVGWTVKDLREALAEVPDDRLVVMSSDAEGNQFHPMMLLGVGEHWHAERYGGDIVSRPRKGDQPCIVLMPMD